jgi:hypothetical protein
MTSIASQDMVGEAATARRLWTSEGLTVEFSGDADMRVFEPLKEFFRGVHDEAVHAGVKKVSIDLRALEFMSSACIKVFVSWLIAIRELPPESQYQLEFLSPRGVGWQRRTLAALSCFALDLVRTVEL